MGDKGKDTGGSRYYVVFLRVMQKCTENYTDSRCILELLQKRLVSRLAVGGEEREKL